MAEWSRALDSSSGVVRMWVRIPAWPVAALVSLSKTLNHNCFVLRMGRKAVGPMCCVMHVEEPRTPIVKEKGLAPVFLDSRLEHPAGWICARYNVQIFCIIIFFIMYIQRCQHFKMKKRSFDTFTYYMYDKLEMAHQLLPIFHMRMHTNKLLNYFSIFSH